MPIKGFTSQCKPNQETIICEQNGRKYTAKNVNRSCVRKYEPDKELSQETKRCDFLVLNVDKKTAYFVEIKGKHLTLALKQLEQTYNLLRSQISGYKYFFRIVASGAVSKNSRGPQYYKFAKKYDLKVETNEIKEPI